MLMHQKNKLDFYLKQLYNLRSLSERKNHEQAGQKGPLTMKTILLFSILLSAITLPATGELTVEDIEKIDAKIQASETRIREDFGEKIQAVDKHMNSNFSWIKFFLTIIAAIVGIPQISVVWRSRKDQAHEQEIEELRNEVEILKQQQVVNP